MKTTFFALGMTLISTFTFAEASNTQPKGKEILPAVKAVIASKNLLNLLEIAKLSQQEGIKVEYTMEDEALHCKVYKDGKLEAECWLCNCGELYKTVHP
jgi:hypothetical protein